MGRLLGIALDFDLEKKRVRIEAAGKNGVKRAKVERRAAKEEVREAKEDVRKANLRLKLERLINKYSATLIKSQRLANQSEDVFQKAKAMEIEINSMEGQLGIPLTPQVSLTPE